MGWRFVIENQESSEERGIGSNIIFIFHSYSRKFLLFQAIALVYILPGNTIFTFSMKSSNSIDKSSLSPVLYRSSFESKELKETKITVEYQDDSKKTAKCPIFDGIYGGLEALFYVIESFLNTIRLEFELVVAGAPDYEECFRYFRRCLSQQALTYWDTEVVTVPGFDPNNPTEDDWTRAIAMLKRSFAGGRHARDHIIEYLASPECRKPLKSTVEDHVRRIKQLIKYANESAGDAITITTAHQVNKTVFDTFPMNWQLNWHSTGRSLAAIELNDLIEYMAQQKVAADYQRPSNSRKNQRNNNNNKRRNDDDEPERFGSFKNRPKRNNNNKKPRGGKRYPHPNDNCPLHPYGSHKWGDCFDNKASDNFKPHNNNQGGYGNRSWRRNDQDHRNSSGRGGGSRNNSRDAHYVDEQQDDRQTSSSTSQGPPSYVSGEQHVYDRIGTEASSTSGSQVSHATRQWPPERNNSTRTNGAWR